MIATSFREAAAAGGRGTMQISGRVPARAGIWLSQTVSFLSGSPRVRTGKTRERLWLTDLDVSANNAQFTVSLVSRNAASLGRPGLVDSVTGATIPYRLMLGGREVSFSDGRARVGTDQMSGGEGPRQLEIDMPAEENVDGGRYQEQLLVVVAAR